MINKFSSFYLKLNIILISSTIFLFSCKKEEQNIDAIPLTLTDAVKVKTIKVSEENYKEVIFEGKIRDDGGKKIISKGICWSKEPYPTITDSIIEAGKGNNDFTGTITHFEENTSYYVRAYAITNEGTAYGNGLYFRSPEFPEITTSIAPFTEITASSATCEGKIIEDGEVNIILTGICWNTSPNPTISNNNFIQPYKSSSFEFEITGLNSGTKYYARAFAINSMDTLYGNTIEFTTSFNIGDTGPAGGIIFYDKGKYSSDWRYLEAAPEDLPDTIWWGCLNSATGAIGSGIGYGLINTNSIIINCETTGAAHLCDEYQLNDFEDWFLPSVNELKELKIVFFQANLSSQVPYWSSTETSENTSEVVFFFEGDPYVLEQDVPKDYDETLTRPIRRF